MGQLNCFECEFCRCSSDRFEAGRKSRKKSLIPYYKGICPYCGREGGLKEVIVMNYN